MYFNGETVKPMWSRINGIFRAHTNCPVWKSDRLITHQNEECCTFVVSSQGHRFGMEMSGHRLVSRSR